MSAVELLGNRFSPFSFRVEIALKLKNIKYDFIEEDLSNKSPALVKYNPIYKKVPVLLHNGKPLAESLVILEYIDHNWDYGTPLLPKDPYHRARARFWAKFIDQKCLPVMRKLVYGNFGDMEKVRDEAQELLKHLENELNGKTLFGGESIGAVDIAACVLGYWLEVIQEAAGVVVFSRETHPKFYKWIDRIFEYDVIKETLPLRQKLLAYYRARIAGGGSFIYVNQL